MGVEDILDLGSPTKCDGHVDSWLKTARLRVADIADSFCDSFSAEK
jgi:hypothetical protein